MRSGFKVRQMWHGTRRFRPHYGLFWGRPYGSFMWWRPFWWYPMWWRPLYWLPWTMMMGGFLYLLYDSMAYKLYRDDVERLERETAKPVKDLSQEELLEAMKRLGIQKLEITPTDKEKIAKSGREKAKYCIYCGAKVSEEGVYCSSCGRKSG